MKPFSLAEFFPRSWVMSEEEAVLVDKAAQAEPVPALPRAPKQRPYNVGRNVAKRERAAAYATAKGCPGGWKKVVRRIIIAAKTYGITWPVLK